jgi:ankyrin repeat protein
VEKVPKSSTRLTAAQVLQKYTNDTLPEFMDRPIKDVNQVGATGDRPIHVACIRGSLEDVAALLEGGAEVNAAGDLGYTPLHYAASGGHLDVAKILLSHGADVAAQNEFGQTPADVARLIEKREIVEALESEKKARS